MHPVIPFVRALVGRQVNVQNRLWNKLQKEQRFELNAEEIEEIRTAYGGDERDVMRVVAMIQGAITTDGGDFARRVAEKKG
jgi:hypothetical protein